MIRSICKGIFITTLGVALLGCSGNEVDLAPSSRLPNFETSFGTFSIDNVLLSVDKRFHSHLWNANVDRYLSDLEYENGKVAHYFLVPLEKVNAKRLEIIGFLAVGSDIPSALNGGFSHEFGALNIFSSGFDDIHPIIHKDAKGIFEITDALNSAVPNWGQLLYSVNLREPNSLDLPYVEDKYMFVYPSRNDKISPLIGYCHVSKKKTSVRCRFSGIFDNKIPFAYQFDKDIGADANLMTPNPVNSFLVGEFLELAELQHDAEIFLTSLFGGSGE